MRKHHNYDQNEDGPQNISETKSSYKSFDNKQTFQSINLKPNEACKNSLASGYRAIRFQKTKNQSNNEINRQESTLSSTKISLSNAFNVSQKYKISKKSMQSLAQNIAAIENLNFENLNSNDNNDICFIELIIQTALNQEVPEKDDESNIQNYLKQISLINLLKAYDEVIKQNRNIIDSLQEKRIYRQLLKMHRENQQSLESIYVSNTQQKERSKSNDSYDILPEKQEYYESQKVEKQIILKNQMSTKMNVKKPPKMIHLRYKKETLQIQSNRNLYPQNPLEGILIQQKPDQSTQFTTFNDKTIDSKAAANPYKRKSSEKKKSQNEQSKQQDNENMKSFSNNTQSLGDFYLKPQVKQFEKNYVNMINDSSTNNLISMNEDDEITNLKSQNIQSELNLNEQQNQKSNDSTQQIYNSCQRHHFTQQNSRNISQQNSKISSCSKNFDIKQINKKRRLSYGSKSQEKIVIKENIIKNKSKFIKNGEKYFPLRNKQMNADLFLDQKSESNIFEIKPDDNLQQSIMDSPIPQDAPIPLEKPIQPNLITINQIEDAINVLESARNIQKQYFYGVKAQSGLKIQKSKSHRCIEQNNQIQEIKKQNIIEIPNIKNLHKDIINLDNQIIQELKENNIQSIQKIQVKKSAQDLKSQQIQIYIQQDNQNEKRAVKFHALKQNKKTFQNLKKLLLRKRNYQKSIQFRNNKLMQIHFDNLKYYVNIIVPEERTMQVALKQYQILMKIKVLRELKKIVKTKKGKKQIFLDTIEQQNQNKKQMYFDILVKFTFNQKRKRILIHKYEQFLRRSLLKKGLQNIKMLALSYKNMYQIQLKAQLYHYSILMKKTLSVLQNYKEKKQHFNILNRLSEDFKKYNLEKWQSITKIAILTALQKNAQKQSKNKFVKNYCNNQLLKRAWNQFLQSIKIQQNINQQKMISQELYNQKILQSTFYKLFYNVKESKKQENMINLRFDQQKLKRIMSNLKYQTDLNSIKKGMTNINQIKCSLLMLESNFGYQFENLSHNQKILKCIEVFNGKVELPLPNFIQVSKSQKYCEYFIQANIILLDHLKHKAFYQLAKNKIFSRNLMIKNQSRILRDSFYLFKKTIEGEKLLQKYLLRSKQVRELQFMRDVFYQFKQQIHKQIQKDNRFCAVLKIIKDKILFKTFKTWNQKYNYSKKKKFLKAKSIAFMKKKYFNEYLSRWLSKLADKIKQKYLYENIFPAAQLKFVISKKFKQWRSAFKKNIYLEDQLSSIDKFQNSKLISTCYKAIKIYSKDRSLKKQKYNYARQVYIYKLGLRIYKAFVINKNNNRLKNQLYYQLLKDFNFKQMAKIIKFMRNYISFRKDKRSIDYLYIQQIQKIRMKYEFKSWLNISRQFKIIKYFQAIIDEVKIKKYFLKLNKFSQSLESKYDQIQRRKNKYFIKKQYFIALYRQVEKKYKHIELSEIIQFNKNIYRKNRFLNLWKSALQKKLNNYKIFKWTIIQIKNQILKKYLLGLKRYSRYQILKRQSPLLYIENFMRKVFQHFYIFSLLSQKHASIQAFTENQRQQKTKLQVFKILKYRKDYQQILRQRQIVFNILKFQKLFNFLKTYTFTKLNERNDFQIKLMKLLKFKKQQGLLKLIKNIDEQVSMKQKYKIAECFKNQIRIQQTYISWKEYYQNNKMFIQKQIQIQKGYKVNLRKQFYLIWKNNAWRSLQKCQGKLVFSKIFIKRKINDYFKKWIEFLRLYQNLDEKSIELKNKFENNTKLTVLKILIENVMQKQTKTQRLQSIDQYTQDKLKNLAYQSLKWYLQERRDKKDMQSIAYAQKISQVYRAFFIAINKVIEKKKFFARALIEFQFIKFQIIANKFIKNLKYQIIKKQNKALLQEKSKLFYQFKLCSKFFQILKQFSENIKQQIQNYRKILQIYKLKRIIDSYKDIIQKQKSTQILKQQIQKKQTLKYFIIWVEQYNKNKKVQDHQTQQNFQLKEICFGAIKQISVIKKIKAAQNQIAKQNYERILMAKTFESILKKTNTKNCYKQLDCKHKLKITFKFFNDWHSLLLIKNIQNKNKKKYILNVFDALKAYKNYKKRKIDFPKKQEQIQKNHQLQMIKMIFKIFKKAFRAQLLCTKIKKALIMKYQESFQNIYDFSRKEEKLSLIEKEFQQENSIKTKNKYLYEWAILLQKNRKINEFLNHAQKAKKQLVFKVINEYSQLKQMEKSNQEQFIQYFSKKRPQCLLMFSKVFMILNTNQRSEEDMSQAPKNLPICQTVLAKYVFDKWKINIKYMKIRNRQNMLANQQLSLVLKSKYLRILRNQTSIKSKERQLLHHGRELYEDNILKKAFDILTEYRDKRANIRLLNKIGNEFMNIRESQMVSQTLLQWYDLTVQSQENEKQIVEPFIHIGMENLKAQVFQQLQLHAQERAEKRKIKSKMNQFADQIYTKNLIKKAFEAVKITIQNENNELIISKLYPVFQAWKFYVKENSLLKKYLSQFDDSKLQTLDDLNDR